MPIFLIGIDSMAEVIHFSDRIAWIWRSGAYRNLLLIAMIAAAILLIRYAARREYWRSAARQVRGAPARDGFLCYFVGLCIDWIAR